jgi:class 3 adenylate cyclase
MSVSLLVLTSLATVILVQWKSSRDNTVEMMGAVSWLILEYMEQGVNDHMQPTVDQLVAVASVFEQHNYDLQDRDTLLQFFRGSTTAVPQVATLGFIDTDLNAVGVRWRKNVRVDINGSMAADLEIQAILADAQKREEPYWGRILYREERVLINRIFPIWRDGQFRGILFSTTTVAALSDLTASLSDLFGSTAFILGGKDQVLAHPNIQGVHPAQTISTPLIKLSQTGDPVLMNVWSGAALREIEDRDDALTAKEITVGKTKYAVIYRQVDSFGATPWYIGAWFEIARIDQAFDRLKISLYISLGLIVLSLVAAIILGRFVGRPIRRLADGATQIGALDIANVERLPNSHISELDEQARAFNTMIASLRAFETYVPRSLVQRLLKSGEDQVVLSEERELTIMFTDIAGFTSMSENMPAQEVATFLNDHLQILGTAVEREEGTIDKFIGDALMAFWGAPVPQDDKVARACRAALAMKKAIATDNHKRRTEGKDAIRVRVGIHSGPVVVGNVGWPGRMNYTIVGDAVNACQRLESLGKEFDIGEEVTILVSAQAAEQVQGQFTLSHVGARQVKGKQTALEIYRLSED